MRPRLLCPRPEPYPALAPMEANTEYIQTKTRPLPIAGKTNGVPNNVAGALVARLTRAGKRTIQNDFPSIIVRFNRLWDADLARQSECLSSCRRRN